MRLALALLFALVVLAPIRTPASVLITLPGVSCTTSVTTDARFAVLVAGQDVCYDATLQKWMSWDGTRFVFAPIGQVSTVNVRDFNAKGDGVTDDRAAIALAVAALPSSGATLSFPCGTYFTSSASALLSITDKNSVTIQGGGQGCTILKNTGGGHGIELLGTAEILNPRVSDLSLLGGSTGTGRGIDTNNMKDGLIERVNVTNFIGDGIAIRGAPNLNNVIRGPGRITSANDAAANAFAGIVMQGNANRVEQVYFNIGGNGATRYGIAVDMTRLGTCASCFLGRNIYDGVGIAVKTAGTTTIDTDWFDTSSAPPAAITTAVQLTANSPVVVLRPKGITADTVFSDAGFSFNNWTVIGADAAGDAAGHAFISVVSGQPTGGSLTATFGVSQNDYNPSANGWHLAWFKNTRLTASVGGLSVTGLQAPGLVAGGGGGGELELSITNIGGNTFAITNQDVGSSANNRIITNTGATINLATDKTATLRYDATTFRWRVIGVTP